MVRYNPITPTERAQCVATMIANTGRYGVVTALGRDLRVSRQTLYNWKAQGQQALVGAFSPAEAISPLDLERSILTVWMDGHASERGIQRCLEVLGWGAISLGKVAGVVSQAQERALECTAHLQAPATLRGIALDELFVRRQGGAALSIVDVESWAVWQTAGPVTVDLDAWVLTLWEAQEHGLRWHTTVSDGNRAISGAAALVDPSGCHVRDVWHILHEAGLVQGRLDRQLQRLVERGPAIARQAARVAAGQPVRGRHPLSDVATYEAQVGRERGVAEGLRYLRRELRGLLEVVVIDGQGVLASGTRQEELATVVGLVEELAIVGGTPDRRELYNLALTLRHALPDLTRWTPALDELQAQAQATLGGEGLALVAWAWQRRRVLGPTMAKLLEQLPMGWREAAGEVMAAWERVVRASSAVENWHSLLRPHLAVHRRLTPGLLALVAVWHNHRVFERGLRRGRNPLQISGITDAPTDWLVALGYPPLAGAAPSTQPAIIADELPMAA